MSTELRNRIAFGLFLTMVVVAAVVSDTQRSDHLGTLALALAACALGCREYARLVRSLVPDARMAPMLVVNLLLVGEAWVHSQGAGWWTDQPLAACLIGLGLAWTVIDQMTRRGPDGVFAHIGATMLGVLYLGIPLHLLLRLAILPDGGLLLLAFLCAVKMGDIAAYFGGKTFGRHKLCPSISPGKTWEGFACSFVGSIGGTYLCCWALTAWAGRMPFDGWWQPAVWGLILGPLGVIGDLIESCFKRAAGVKDSGSSMPGFGGVLDLLDALIIAAPVAYLLAVLL